MAIALAPAAACAQTITIDFQNKVVSPDGLTWTFDIAAKGIAVGTIYEGPDNDNWQAMNIRLDLDLPAGVTIVGGSGIGELANTTGQVGVQTVVPGIGSVGKSALGLTIARSAPPGLPGQQDINVNDYTKLATFTVTFSGQVFNSTKAYPRLALNKDGSSWTNVSDSKRRPISFGGAPGSTMGTITLPVKLVNFDAKKENRTAHLTWATSEEIDAAYFEVQKSSDGKSWNTISKVDAQGDSKQVTKYEATDAAPYGGTNLYRLHMVDLDGSDAYSTIRSLVFENTSVALYPNPAQKALYVKTDANEKVKAVDITDLQGRVIYKGNATAIDTDQYAAGKYVVSVTLENGSVSRHEVIIAP